MPTLQRGTMTPPGRNSFKAENVTFDQPINAANNRSMRSRCSGAESTAMMNVQTLAFVGFGLAWAAIITLAWYQHLPLLPAW
jgi:hypothetical protein